MHQQALFQSAFNFIIYLFTTFQTSCKVNYYIFFTPQMSITVTVGGCKYVYNTQCRRNADNISVLPHHCKKINKMRSCN